jgi:hypothetical protein
MSKFQKRSTERKGERKNSELEEKLIQDNLKDLVSEGGELSD